MPGGTTARRVRVALRSYEIRDCSKDLERSRWGQILSYRASASRPRDSRAMMASVQLDFVRPDPELDPELEELRLSVALLPLR